MDTTVYGPVGPEVGHTALIGPLTARTMLPTEVAEGRLSIVEHCLDPEEPGAPLHRHAQEDEYTVVVEGRGVLLGEDVYEAGPGELVLKPRHQWHTFWNPVEDRCRLLKLICPAGGEQFFQDVGPFFPHNAEPDFAGILGACERFGL
ncbi:cupin domain-containing protein [Kocuria sp.]|uniref:cupin domain-containing protein n=1 Tax=Kocuria sp. TaxID=1871328 RepID=UPI002811E771|nr:cupin domain-containing protein [Kocuria sp.]